MSQENTNMSAPSRLGNRSPESAGLIEWYDSPKFLFSSQTKISRRSLLLMKTRSAEEFSPSRSSVNGTPSTSDFDSLWCPGTSNENTAPFEGDEASFSLFGNEDAQSSGSLTTPHRSHRLDKTHLRRKRLRSDQHEVTEKKSTDSQGSMSMEEGLALGRASLVKLRQRLRSEGDAKNNEEETKKFICCTPHGKAAQRTPNLTPIPCERMAQKTCDVVITPSLVRTQQPSSFSTSTPKRPYATAISATPLKRFRTMNDNAERTECSRKDKIARTQSMNVTNDGSDDDSFLDDVFMPFTDPDQFTQMLKKNNPKK
ncbi:hypothetical protein OSTOST_20117 [Ostertagia ostertagi]